MYLQNRAGGAHQPWSTTTHPLDLAVVVRVHDVIWLVVGLNFDGGHVSDLRVALAISCMAATPVVGLTNPAARRQAGRQAM